MRIRAAVASIALAMASAGLLCQPTQAQGPMGAPMRGYSPGLFNMGQSNMGRSSDLMDAHGNRAVVPAQYCQGGGCQGGGPGGGCYGGGGGGGYAGGYGGPTPCDDPFGGGGALVEQCGPHYFDASVEYVMYQRADYGSFSQQLMTENVLPGGTPVLSTGDLSNDYEAGFRLTGRYDIGPLAVIEFGYTGFFDMGDGASYVDENPVSPTEGNGYSLYTDFGQNPVNAVGTNPAYFAETDRAVAASVAVETELQTAEISYRRYWVGHSPRVSGTWLYGFRYTRLKDMFNFNTLANGSFNNYIEAENDLSGFQFGGDTWVTMRQGLRAGVEGKVGVYGNQLSIENRLQTSPVDTVNINDAFEDEQVSFIGELRLMMVADIHPSISVKAGYEVLFLSSIATAVDNFNPASPYPEGAGAPQSAIFWTQSDALFHGFHAGLEYVW